MKMSIAILAILGMLALSDLAQAFTLSLSGETAGEQGAAVAEGTDVLYATDRAGREMELAKVGPWHGVDLQDLGVPSISNNGTVLFAGAIIQHGELRWQMFLANPDRGSVTSLELPEPLAMRADPRPIAGPDGSVIFSVTDPMEAIYSALDGKLTCLLKEGQQLPDGRTVHTIASGSVDVAQDNAIALIAFLEPGGESELLVSKKDVTIVAAGGYKTPDGGRFLHLGRPAITQWHDELTLVFKARTDQGDHLYTYRQGKLSLALAAGVPCPGGNVTFMSDDKPDLVEGGIAINASCTGQLKRLLIAGGKVIASDAPYHLISAQPIADASLTSTHWVEGASISINRNGQAAYLGSRRPPERH